MRRLLPFIPVILLLLTLVIVQQRALTQESDTCPPLVTQALQSVGPNCESLGRNSACYGFNRVNATFNQTVAEDFFTRPSDQTTLASLASIDTAPYSTELTEWGVALMRVQANLPDSLPGQAVTFVLLGDVQIENAVQPVDAFQPAANPISLTAQTNANIRSRPTTQSNVVGSVENGTALSADAISPDSQWLRVVFGNRAPGWINRQLVQASGDVDSLPVFSSDSLTPMQAFYFRTAIGQLDCNQSPSALVVQGPERVTVDITANGANIRIGSTILLQTLPNNRMRMLTISGEAEIDGVNVPGGFQVDMQLNEDGTEPEGPPEDLQPAPQDELDELQWLEDFPPELLNYPIEIQDREVPPTPVPSNNTGGGGGSAGGNTTNTGQADCRAFRATSPLDGLAYGINTFYWDAAPGATSYRVSVEGGPSATIAAPTTTLQLDLSNVGFNPQLSWKVEALVNDRVACTSQVVTIPREWAPTPVPAPTNPPATAPGPAFAAGVTCSGLNTYNVDYAGLPGGTTTVTITYTDAPASSVSPPSPAVTAVPPDPGSVFLFGSGPTTITNITITANPSSVSVFLPGPYSC